MRAIKYFLVFCLVAMMGVRPANAFTLLGPFAPWMTPRLSYHIGNDIGGPMNIGEGYRWNVPVLTYGFDPSFVEFFGSNGVAAVESAIQIFNDLPPASTINLSNYFLNTSRVNHRAEALGLMDLKSAALALLIEHLGLASPTRYSFTLQSFTDVNDYTVIMRNFDPRSLAPSPYVNGTLYADDPYYIFFDGNEAYLPIYSVDPAAYTDDAVADNSLSSGGFYTNLTYDDVGGLRYLYSTNNVAVENLIPGVHGVGRNKHHFVKTALRPGMDKITFQRLDYDTHSHHFVPASLQFEDSYITNNTLQHQTLERVVREPDILFTAPDLAPLEYYSRTGTSNWVNNGLPGHDGPGIIQPPVKIEFDRLCPALYNGYPISLDYYYSGDLWGSYDFTTNAPVIYPIPAPATNSTKFDFWLYSFGTAPTRHFSWNLVGQPGATFLLQTSTDLTNWTTLTSVTNTGWNFTYAGLTAFTYASPQLQFPPHRFYRTLPQ